MTRQKRDLATVISSSRVAEGSLSPNAAACDLTEQPGSSTSRTARRESKRNEAAQLAQELATSGSWSEAFSPRTYGTIASPQNGIQIARDSTRLVSDSAESQPANMTYQDFDPPPAYSKRADIHELPVDGSSSASLPSEEPLLAQGADSEQESEGERTNDEEARTFLGRRRCRHHSKRDWTPWIRKGKGLARKRVRLLLLMLLLAVVGSAISCIVYRSSLRSKVMVFAFVLTSLTDCRMKTISCHFLLDHHKLLYPLVPATRSTRRRVKLPDYINCKSGLN